MNRPYGPWATLITAGQNPQLSAFWRRRMGMLAAVSKASSSLSRQSVALLIAAAACVFLLPTLRAQPRQTATKEAQGAHEAGSKAEAGVTSPAKNEVPILSQTLRGHPGTVYCVVFSADGNALVSGAADGTIRVWNVVTGKSAATWRVPKAGGNPHETILVRGIALSPDGRTVAAGCAGSTTFGTIRLWDVAGGKITAEFTGYDQPWRVGTPGIYSLVYTLDGKRLLTGNEDNLVRSWDAGSGKTIVTFEADTGEVGYCIALSPDGKLVAFGGSKGTIKLWDLASRRNTLTVESGGSGNPVDSLAFSPDGRLLASACHLKGVRLWDISNGRNVADFKPDADDIGFSVAFSRDGKTLAIGCENGPIRLADVKSGRKLASLAGHTGLVRSLAFSPDDKTLASASDDGTIKLWKVSQKPH